MDGPMKREAERTSWDGLVGNGVSATSRLWSQGFGAKCGSALRFATTPHIRSEARPTCWSALPTWATSRASSGRPEGSARRSSRSGLVRDGGIRGVVVSLSHLDAIKDEPGVGLYAEAGIGMPALMQQAARRGLGGLEWAAGIPGTLGGCVVMNAGTRLGEMSTAVQSVRIVTPAGLIKDYPRSALTFSYRRTRLPSGIVAGVWLRLSHAPPEEIAAAVKTYLRYRKATQPLTEPNAGCVFKNPPGQSAGALIERAGLKGSRMGDAQVSERHGNFIVNRGRARSADAIALIRKVRRIVKARCGVVLELEQKIVGDA